MANTNFVTIRIKTDHMDGCGVTGAIRDGGIHLRIDEGWKKHTMESMMTGNYTSSREHNAAELTVPVEVAEELGHKLVLAAQQHANVMAVVDAQAAAVKAASEAAQAEIEAMFK